MSSWLRALPNLATPYPVTASGLVISGTALYWGAVLRETAGLAIVTATVTDAVAGAGVTIDLFSCPINGVDRGPQSNMAILCERGITVTFAGTGVPNMVVWAVPSDLLIHLGDDLVSDIYSQVLQ